MEKTISPSSETTLPPSELRSHANKPMLIDIDTVSVRLGSDQALENISLCMHAGEFIGIIGPNGAGKTTLLRTMLGLIKPSSGSINRDETAISYVPQRGNIYNSQIPISVTEVVTLGSKGDKTKALEMLERVGMQAVARKPFSDLSGGQQQRVAIAKALASDPQVLMLDEPTTGIDEAAQHVFYDTLRELQKQGLTIVIVSHDIDAVLNLVTRVICLNKTILYDGSPEHFEADKYLPSAYKTHHRLLHHHHGEQGVSHA